MKKKKILWVLNGLLSNGISMFVLNFLSNMDLEKYEYHLGISGNYIDKELFEKIEKLNIKIHIFPCRKRNTIRYFYQLKNYIKENKIDLVHFHGNSSTLVIDLLAAKLAGCKRRVAHSHNSESQYRKLNMLLRPIFNLLYTTGIACSENASLNMFGGNKKNIYILKNGIDTKKFKYNSKIRREIRKKLNISDSQVVLGHVGGFNNQKNQKFLVDLYKKISDESSKYILIFVGDGKMSDEIKRYTKELGISTNSIRFLGNRHDIERIMNCFDCFVFPSIFEGLGIVMIEAQSIGLSCIASEHVPSITNVTGNVSFLPLNLDSWKDKILNNNFSVLPEQVKLVKDGGWDVRSCAKNLENIYLKEGV